MILFAKQKQAHRYKKTNTWAPRREASGRMNWEIGVDTYTPLILCIKQIALPW